MNKKGFTLVELLVVIVIIGVLLAIILPNAIRAIRQANTKQCASNIRSVDTACQMFYSENRTWPTNINPDLLPYLEDNTEPICPITRGNYALEAANDRCSRAGHFVPPAGIWPDTHN